MKIINLHDNFHPHTNRASSNPVKCPQIFLRISSGCFFFFMDPPCLPISIALPMTHHLGSLISKIRVVLQDAPKASALRKSELCWFCTETDGTDRSVSLFHSQSLSSKEALHVLGCLTRSFLLSVRNLMTLHNLLLCAISSFKEEENQFIGGTWESHHLLSFFLPFSLSCLLIK